MGVSLCHSKTLNSGVKLFLFYVHYDDFEILILVLKVTVFSVFVANTNKLR